METGDAMGGYVRHGMYMLIETRVRRGEDTQVGWRVYRWIFGEVGMLQICFCGVLESGADCTLILCVLSCSDRHALKPLLEHS